MSYKNPPIETRFPVNRKDHTQKGPYLIPLLRRLIEKKICYEDPETQKIIKGRVKDAILWRYILNATQGENQAIEGILDRIDGKVEQKLKGEGFASQNIQVIINKAKKLKDGEDRIQPDIKADRSV